MRNTDVVDMTISLRKRLEAIEKGDTLCRPHPKWVTVGGGGTGGGGTSTGDYLYADYGGGSSFAGLYIDMGEVVIGGSPAGILTVLQVWVNVAPSDKGSGGPLGHSAAVALGPGAYYTVDGDGNYAIEVYMTGTLIDKLNELSPGNNSQFLSMTYAAAGGDRATALSNGIYHDGYFIGGSIPSEPEAMAQVNYFNFYLTP